MKDEILGQLKKRNTSVKFIEKIRFSGKVIRCYLDIFGKLNITISSHEYQEISEEELSDFGEWLKTLELKPKG